MGKQGFIKIHRKLLDWGWYSDSVVKDVFLHILMIANWKNSEYLGYKLKAGDAIIGRKKLAQELGFSERQIRTALSKLESTGEISLKTTSRFTIVSVANWEFYQCDDDVSDQQATNKRPTSDQQATNKRPLMKNNKNNKNDKKDKNNIFIAPAREEVKAYCIERGNSVDVDAFIDFYESKGWMVGKNKMKDWRAAVRNWERNRASKSTASEGRLNWIDNVNL